jgi:hypothetical protein
LVVVAVVRPRIVTPGATLLITRRTYDRRFLLRPDPELDQIYLYALAVAASRFGVEVHALILMATHEHLAATDVLGQAPRFLHMLHRSVALAVKVLRRWHEDTWDSAPPSVVELRTRQAVIEKIAYTITNPVSAGLVRYSRDWPGLKVRVDELGRRTWTVRRPAHWFDPDNPDWPEEVTLTVTWPPGLLDGTTEDAVRAEIAAEVERREREARDAVRREGRTFMGADAVLRASPYRRAKSYEPIRDRFPTFAVGAGRREAYLEAVIELRAFRAAYRDALWRWRHGDRTAVFPRGTWWMHRFHGAPVATEPIAAAAA